MALLDQGDWIPCPMQAFTLVGGNKSVYIDGGRGFSRAGGIFFCLRRQQTE